MNPILERRQKLKVRNFPLFCSFNLLLILCINIIHCSWN